MNNNRKLYVNILEKFHSSNQNFIDDLKKNIDGDDLETAHRLVHTLKGVSGNIGADELHNYIVDIEKLLLNNEISEFKVEIPNLEKILLNLLLSINDGLKLDSKVETQDVDLEKIKILLPNLEELLKKKSPKAKGIVENLELAGLASDNFTKLKKEMGKYNFKQALILLNEIIRTMET